MLAHDEQHASAPRQHQASSGEGSGGRSGGKGLGVKPPGGQRDSIQCEEGEEGAPVGRKVRVVHSARLREVDRSSGRTEVRALTPDAARWRVDARGPA